MSLAPALLRIFGVARTRYGATIVWNETRLADGGVDESGEFALIVSFFMPDGKFTLRRILRRCARVGYCYTHTHIALSFLVYSINDEQKNLSGPFSQDSCLRTCSTEYTVHFLYSNGLQIYLWITSRHECHIPVDDRESKA